MEIVSLAERKDLLDDLRNLMNLCLWRDFIGVRLFRKVTTEDPNFEHKYVLVALDKGTPVGFVHGVRRIAEPKDQLGPHREIGWIKAFGTLRELADRSLLHELLSTIEERLRGDGCRFLRVSDFASWYIAPGVDVRYELYNEVLVERGYDTVGRSVNYELDMMEFRYPGYVERLKSALVREGVNIYKVEERDEALLKFVESKFSSFWRLEVSMAIDEEQGGAIAAEVDGEIVGFSVYGSISESWFGPVGVDPDFRGKGLGTVLLYDTLLEMRKRGVRVVVIPWTSHLFYYAQLPGVRWIRLFNIYQREL